MINRGNPANLTRVLFGIVLGVAVFMMAQMDWSTQLPAIPVPPMREGRARASTTALLFFIGFVGVIAVLYTTALPRLLLVTVVVAASWAYGAFTWLMAKNGSERWRAVFIAGMGGLLAFTSGSLCYVWNVTVLSLQAAGCI